MLQKTSQHFQIVSIFLSIFIGRYIHNTSYALKNSHKVVYEDLEEQ